MRLVNRRVPSILYGLFLLPVALDKVEKSVLSISSLLLISSLLPEHSHSSENLFDAWSSSLVLLNDEYVSWLKTTGFSPRAIRRPLRVSGLPWLKKLTELKIYTMPDGDDLRASKAFPERTV